jgi:hypothetical protein
MQSSARSESLPALAEIETSPLSERRLVSASGASVTLRESTHESRIEVRDASSRLVFDFDLATGRAVVAVPGDLSLSAGGDVEIAAGGAVRCRGQEVELTAGRVGKEQTKVRLDGGALRFTSRLLGVLADRADLAFGDARLASERLRAEVKDGQLVATRLETAADRIFEQARNVFRTASELHQLTAGRTREIVHGGSHLKAGHVSVEADDDVKIDGKAIHLG